MRFFFDYTREDQALYDYKGDEFLSSKDAFDFAEATAQFLTTLQGEWRGWSIEVRNDLGRKFFTVPIDGLASLAA